MDIISIPGFTEPVSCWTHLIAAALAFVGLVFLLKRGRGNGPRVTALVVFSFSLVFLFSMSGVYHLLEIGGSPREVLQRLDHAGIWVLIAGTFTPIHTILFRGAWRWAILMLVWSIAITGLVLEVVFFTDFPEWLALSCFLGLGWIGGLTGGRFFHLFRDSSIRLLVGGGIFYSLGAVMDFADWPVIWPGVIGAHEVFHLFVMAGSFCHWQFVYRWAAHPVADRVTFRVQVFPSNQYIAQAVGERLIIEADSLDRLKEAIRQRVRDKFHHSIQPKIHLRYFEEEHL